MSQGNATSKRTGERCRAQAVTGNAKCRHHGGKSLVGPASGTWVDGRHSKVLPGQLLETYREAMQDPDRLELAAEIALIDARINDLLRRVDSGESGQLWRMLREARQDYAAARRGKDPVVMAVAVNAMCELIDRGASDAAAWTEVTGLIDRRRRLVDSESRRQERDRQTVTADQALALLGLLVTAVQQHVHDRDALRAISDEYARLTGLSQRPVA